jgi:hypothetical protein
MRRDAYRKAEESRREMGDFALAFSPVQEHTSK